MTERMKMKRKNEIKIRLSDAEMVRLNMNVAGCGLSREGYIRQLINGYVPKAAPPQDYYDMMMQLYRIGNNLNQIAKLAHMTGEVNAARYDIYVKMLEDAIVDITKAVLMPERIDDGDNVNMEG